VVTAAPDGRLFVSCLQGLLVYAADRSDVTYIPAQKMNGPRGVAFSAGGEIFVCEFFNDNIAVFDERLQRRLCTLGSFPIVSKRTGRRGSPWAVAVDDNAQMLYASIEDQVVGVALAEVRNFYTSEVKLSSRVPSWRSCLKASDLKSRRDDAGLAVSVRALGFAAKTKELFVSGSSHDGVSVFGIVFFYAVKESLVVCALDIQQGNGLHAHHYASASSACAWLCV
jgi:DNA-binding beta-propeller fold protein YncE